MDMRLELGQAEINMQQWWQVVIRAITTCLHETKSKTIMSFGRVGTRHNQIFLSDFVRKRVMVDSNDFFEATTPTKEELQLVAGTGIIQPHVQIMRPVEQTLQAGPPRTSMLSLYLSTALASSSAAPFAVPSLVPPEDEDLPIRTHEIVLRRR